MKNQSQTIFYWVFSSEIQNYFFFDVPRKKSHEYVPGHLELSRSHGVHLFNYFD